jgi:hypothetical protein
MYLMFILTSWIMHLAVRDVLLFLQAPLYWDIYVPLGLDSARLAFTCHNFEYQGAENSGAISACGLSARDLMRPDRMQDNSFHNKINLLKVIDICRTF